MTQITAFNRNEHHLVSTKVLAALKTLESELGVTFSAKGGQTGQNGGFIRLGVEVAGGGEADWKRYAPLVNLPADAYDKTFSHEGVTYRTTGINLNAPKYPVNVERAIDGKPYRMPATLVSAALK